MSDSVPTLRVYFGQEAEEKYKERFSNAVKCQDFSGTAPNLARDNAAERAGIDPGHAAAILADVKTKHGVSSER
jgi:hypothetical protein